MASLQDQLLKTGLIDQNKAKKANADKRKQIKAARKSKQRSTSQSSLTVDKKHARQVSIDRELNRQQRELADNKAIAAQIAQMIKMNKIDRKDGDVGYSFVDKFVDKGKIKKIYMTENQQLQLATGQLAIVYLKENNQHRYEVVPTTVANKIAQRDSNCVVQINFQGGVEQNQTDPYADFQVPDDLMW